MAFALLGEEEEAYEELQNEVPNLIVEELEKIKAKIENLTYYWCEVNPNSVKDDVLKIIDKEISELKGDNNAEC